MTYTQPDLLDYLTSTVLTVEVVAPNLFDRAHEAGDVIVQQGGHFAMESLNGHDGQHGAWVFIDLGGVLGVVTCAVHGNTIDPVRARALAAALTSWADRRTS